jgi:hypothetical protein
MGKEQLAALGSVAATTATSICCIGSLLALLLGDGSIAAASKLENWRPAFLALTSALPALAWFFTPRKPKGQCAAGATCAKTPFANGRDETGRCPGVGSTHPPGQTEAASTKARWLIRAYGSFSNTKSPVFAAL